MENHSIGPAFSLVPHWQTAPRDSTNSAALSMILPMAIYRIVRSLWQIFALA
jgi:hypothetical protein